MGVSHTVHGFRASFRSWGANFSHYDHDMLEVASSHVLGGATVRAHHRSDMVEKRRELVKEWATYIENTSDSELLISSTVLAAI